jgi:hypothetical protein
MGTPARNGRINGRKPGNGNPAGRSTNFSRSSKSSNGAGGPGSSGRGGKGSEEHPILYQDYFKSVGPRTYAAQVKKAGNGNHYLVLTEGKRDEATNEVRKTRLFLFSEDFAAFFKMMKATAEFIKANPVPPEVVKKRNAFWAKAGSADAGAAGEKTSPEDRRDHRPRGAPGEAPAEKAAAPMAQATSG